MSMMHFSETSLVSEYKWVISNFSSVTDKIISSPVFSHNIIRFQRDVKWKINVYPDGTENNKGYISIFLQSLNSFDVRVDYDFTIPNINIYHRTKSNNCSFKGSEEFGKNRFAKRSILLTELEKEDALTIILKICYFQKPILTEPQLNLLKNVNSLIKRRELCDVTLITSDGTEHKAHKAILICRSKVFLAMFQNNMKESQENVVKIEDVDSETLKALLEFIYTGEVRNMKNKAEKLLLTADKYELNDLRAICIQYISGNMTFDNILDFIVFAHAYDIHELQLKTKEYFLQNSKFIISTKGRDFLQTLPRDVIDDLFYNYLVSDSESK